MGAGLGGLETYPEYGFVGSAGDGDVCCAEIIPLECGCAHEGSDAKGAERCDGAAFYGENLRYT